MKYAVVKTGGKQYKVAEGDVIEVERLSEAEPKKSYTFNDVLLYVADGALKVGSPRVDGVVVKGLVEDHVRGEKIRVSKYKAKARYRRVTGHRQALTRLTISEISTGGVAKSEEKPKRQPRVKKA